MKLVSPELQKTGKRHNYAALLGPWIAFIALAGLIAALFSVVTTLGAGVASGYTKDRFYCDSSSKIRWRDSDSRYTEKSPYWDGALFLSVTMGLHGLSYPQAKAIDICFDLIVGRGSQVLAAFAAYPILRRAILRSMETREFSLAMLIPFFLERISAFTLWALTVNMRTVQARKLGSQDPPRRPRNRLDWRIMLVISIGCYILALPTSLSAMTSYQARSAPFVPLDDGSSYLSAEKLTAPDFYIFSGAPQVGMQDGFPLYNDTTDPELLATIVGYFTTLEQDIPNIWWNDWKNYRLTDSDLPAETLFDQVLDTLPVTRYISDTHDPPLWTFTIWPRNATYDQISFQHLYHNLINSTIVIRGTNYTLDVPLDIRAVNTAAEGRVTMFAYQNNIMSGLEVERDGKCLPANGYIWGFSSLMLFTFCMITIVVAILLIVLHFDAYCYSYADRYKLYMSPYRDVLDLAHVLDAHFGAAEVASTSARELDKAMQKDPATTGLETVALHPPRALRWRQSPDSKWPFVAKDVGTRPGVDRRGTEAEESLMSTGLDAQSSELEMGKMPAKAVTKQFT